MQIVRLIYQMEKFLFLEVLHNFRKQKILFSILFIFELLSHKTSSNEEQPLYAKTLIISTEEGMLTSYNDLHS